MSALVSRVVPAYVVQAAQSGATHVVRRHVSELRASAASEERLHLCDADGHSLLHWSALSNLRAQAAELLDGDLAALDATGGYLEETPLMWALREEGSAGAAVDLLRRGANPNARNRLGDSCLHLAVRFGHIRTAMALLAFGADTETRDASGDTPLLWLTRSPLAANRVDLVRLLLASGADAEAGDSSGNTCAHLLATVRLYSRSAATCDL